MEGSGAGPIKDRTPSRDRGSMPPRGTDLLMLDWWPAFSDFVRGIHYFLNFKY